MVLRACFAAFCLAFAIAAPAQAGGDAKKAKGDESSANRSVEILNLVAPVVKDGRLINYLYLNIRVELAPSADVWANRAKSHILRDAMVRAVHRTSLGTPDRSFVLDTAAAQRVLTAASQEVLGAASVRSVAVFNYSAQRTSAP
jgi:hypothetical protein